MAAALAAVVVVPSVALGERAAPAKPVISPNWSGYVVFGTDAYDLQLVATDIVVPRVRCAAGETTLTSIWAGIGGYDSHYSLAQVGVSAYCEHGRAGYDLWDEWYDEKKNNPAHVISGVTVLPGEEVSLRVKKVNATHYVASMAEWNPHSGHRLASYGTTLSDAHGLPIGNSAECVVESPAKIKGGYYPLASFGAVTFSPCEASSQPTFEHEVVDVVTGLGYTVTSSHSLSPSFQLYSSRVDLVRAKVLRAAAGPPHPAGAHHPLVSFTVFWKHA